MNAHSRRLLCRNGLLAASENGGVCMDDKECSQPKEIETTSIGIYQVYEDLNKPKLQTRGLRSSTSSISLPATAIPFFPTCHSPNCAQTHKSLFTTFTVQRSNEAMSELSPDPSRSSLAEFVTPGKIDHTPVQNIDGFEDLGATFAELRAIKKPTPYTKSVVDDFVRMYAEVVDKQANQEYVCVSWASALHYVAKRLREFEHNNADTHWILLGLNFWSLQKEAKKFKHEFKFLQISRCFYSMV